MKLTFDGMGLNDASAEYCPRVLTFAKSVSPADRKKIAGQIVAASELLESAEAAFDALDALHNVIVKHGLDADGKFGYAWQQMIDAKEANRAAIAKARGE